MVRNGAAAVVVAISFLIAGAGSEAVAQSSDLPAQSSDLPAMSGMEKGLKIEVKPVELNPDGPAKFSISLKTHSGSLDFDLAAISELKDDKGKIYKPTGWDGSPPGGHHRSGVLSFPKIEAGAKQIKLIIRDVRGVPERTFEWVMP